MTNKLKYQNKFKLITNIIFIFCLFLPLIAIILSPRFFTFLDNIHQNPNSFKAEQEALRRSTLLWTKAVSIYNTTLYQLRVSGNKQAAFYGKDGWLFLGDMGLYNVRQAIHKIILNPEQVQDWVDILKAETAFAHKRGIPFVFVMGPAKWEIYPDKLPTWATPYTKGPYSFDLILKAAKNTNINMIDLRETLRKDRKRADTYSPLNSHWTDYGAWLAWQKIGPAIQKEIPTLKLFGIGPAKYIKKPALTNEFLHLLGINIIDTWTTPLLAVPFPPFTVINSDGSETEFDGNQQTDNTDLPRVTHNNASTSSLTALILRDSMGNALSPFLQSTFRETYQIHYEMEPSSFNIPALIEQYKPDVIIYIMTERHILAPLGDSNFWRSVNLYENAPTSSKHLWTPNKTSDFIKISGDKTLTTPLNIEVPDSKEHSLAVKIVLKGRDEGQLDLRYTKDKRSFSKIQFFGKGLSEHYFTLPKGVSNNSFQIRRNIDQGQLTLVSISTGVKS